MSLFGWHSRRDDEGIGEQSSTYTRHQPVALPPADPSVHELEELLAQAKVGTHEFTHIASHSTPDQRCANEYQEPSSEKNSTPSDEINELTPSVISVVESTVESQVTTPYHDAVAFDITPFVDRVENSSQDIETLVNKKTESNDDKSFESNFEHGSLAIFRTPKFRFFTEDKSVPDQLHSYQQHSCRKRHEFQTRLHDVECKVAELTAKVANENMDLDLDLRKAVGTNVFEPIQAAIETLSLHRYTASGPSLQSTTSLSQRWLELERRLSSLDTKMTHSLHVELQDLKQAHLTSWRDQMEQKVVPEAKEESAASDKRETALARRWENQAGTMARRFAEEHATRAAVLMTASSKLSDLDPCRGQELLVQITLLREKLERERDERRTQDEHIRRYIIDTFEALKLAILEANPDPELLEKF